MSSAASQLCPAANAPVTTRRAAAVSVADGRSSTAGLADLIAAYRTARARAAAAGSGKVNTGRANSESPDPGVRTEPGTAPTLVTMTGLCTPGPACWAAPICASTSSESVTAGSVKMVSTASTSGAARMTRNARPMSSGVMPAPRSIGLRHDAAVGTAFRTRLSVCGDSDTTCRPQPWAASAARMPGPPELPMTTTRRPGGSGWSHRIRAASSICSMVSTRSTPACSNIASTTTSEAAAAAVCDSPARWPAADRPGLDRDDRLARGDRPRDTGELAGVAERLQIQRHHPGAVVVLPGEQQVVAADVGLVAHRDELRDAQAPTRRRRDDRDAERAGLGHQAEAARPARQRARRWRSTALRGRC